MSTNVGEERPLLSAALTGAQLLRWYWTLAELTGLARQMGVTARGGKTALTARLAAALDGLPEPAAACADPGPEVAGAVAPRRAGLQLAAPVDGATVIPPGQRCSQVLREYFVREIGPGFRFDAFMREYVAGHAGHTLGEAVGHWHATRERAAEPQEVGAQFEFNRFLRDWHARHPGGARTDALAAWRAHRARPRG
ncbi:DUF6434 domain-containing protein [Streptomyces erythrochromogenes]|uniref:DUF6434 domain-containing protein n=1 Tax=Streptomyces erythrochromogenes TaxID=285574 RepID=UPI00341BB728